MKKSIKVLISTATDTMIALTLAGSAFADRTLIIDGLPKTPYRSGVGAYEGDVAYSTATPQSILNNINLVDGTQLSYIMR